MRSHDVILGPISGPVVYKGKAFRSTKALIRAEGVVSVGAIESRLNKGWSLAEALKTPLLNEVTYNGKTYRSTKALIRAEGVVSIGTIESRLNKGWSLEEALKKLLTLPRRDAMFGESLFEDGDHVGHIVIFVLAVQLNAASL